MTPGVINRSGHAMAVALVAMLALAGCSGSAPDEPDEAPPSESPSSAPVDTGCVSRTWALDLEDLASQMAIELAADGLEVIEYAGVGRYTFTVSESGEASHSVDATFTVTATSGAGPEITVVQIHTGEPFGLWGWVDATNVMTFEDWNDGGYEVQNITAIDGVNIEGPIDIPSDPLDGANLTVVCEGSTMSTQSEGSPYTHHWTPAPS